MGVIRPLVQRSARIEKQQGMGALAAFTLGSVVGALFLGLLVELVAVAVPARGGRFTLIIWGVFSTSILLADTIGRTPFSRFGVSRQTCPAWRNPTHPARSSFAWGIDLGLGVTTFRVTSAYWVALAGCVLIIPISAIPLVTCCYSIALSIAISYSTVFRTRRPFLTSHLPEHSRFLRDALALVSVLLVLIIAV